MTEYRAAAEIAASAEEVFAVISSPDQMQAALPHVVSWEPLNPPTSDSGMRFRQTRRMGKREMTHEFEVIEFSPPTHLRIVSENTGVVWDTVFTVTPKPSGCRLQLHMTVTASTLLMRIMNRLMRRLITAAMQTDADLIGAYCESHAT